MRDHHLRDLFVEGLVDQPDRGQYRLTDRGEMSTMLVSLVADMAGDAEGSFQVEPHDL